MKLGPATPILRMFDEEKARAFYIDWLRFSVTFEHRFGTNMPLYLGLERDSVELHLSEHHGDTTPGTRVRIAVQDLQGFYDDIMTRPYPHLRPDAPQEQSWGEWDLTLTDPFGNRLSFYEGKA